MDEKEEEEEGKRGDEVEKKKSNKAGYTAKDAPGMRTFNRRKQHGTT